MENVSEGCPEYEENVLLAKILIYQAPLDYCVSSQVVIQYMPIWHTELSVNHIHDSTLNYVYIYKKRCG